jgi:hypothetical protein
LTEGDSLFGKKAANVLAGQNLNRLQYNYERHEETRKNFCDEEGFLDVP